MVIRSLAGLKISFKTKEMEIEKKIVKVFQQASDHRKKTGK